MDKDIIGRVPPHNLDAERAILSALILENSILDRIITLVKPDHFYAPAHEWIYKAAIALHESGCPVDLNTVAAWLRDKGRLPFVGGSAYLVHLLDNIPMVENIDAYANLVRQKWRLRTFIQTCQRLAAQAYGDVGDVQAFLDGAEQAIYEVVRQTESKDLVHISEVVKEVFQRMEACAEAGTMVTGTPSGYKKLDELTTGMQPTDLIILAARPGMGKSALALNIAVNAAVAPNFQEKIQGRAAAIFSLEMPKNQLGSRMVASEARVGLQTIRTGTVKGEQWNYLAQASGYLSGLPIYMDDTAGISVLEMRARLRRLQAMLRAQDTELGLVVIDYLQLMKGNGTEGNREQEISGISRSLKILAKDMHVPVMALSQLNRSVETRSDKRPLLSDLRESGSIEQDADMILFLYRDSYYNKDEDGQPRKKRGDDNNPKGGSDNETEVIIAKQRNGPLGKVILEWHPGYTRFLEPDNSP